jgi:hypothetical protein
MDAVTICIRHVLLKMANAVELSARQFLDISEKKEGVCVFYPLPLFSLGLLESIVQMKKRIM